MEKIDKQLAILCVLEILKAYTDEKHSLTYSEIDEKMQNEYGITIDKKTMAKYINLLIDFGYEIVRKGNNGCALIGRDMDTSELAFLIDAIFSSKSISSKQAKDLIQHLMVSNSVYEKKKFDYIYKADEIARTSNREFFYTIDTISRAIEDNKQISFTYNEVMPNKKLKTRFNGKEFTINPYFMINNHGKYYLVCNYYKYDTLANYKIECISNIKVLDTPIRPLNTLEDTENFDISKYVNEHIYMFSGKTIQETIKIANPKVINDIIDWYGDNIVIKEKDDGIFVTLNVNEQAFLYWALQYGLNIEIIKPIATKNKYVKMINEIILKYKSEEK